MSDLLQRLIDRTREPLSAVRPILPSIYTPADKAENADGRISQTNLAAEQAAQPSSSPTERADEREISETSQPVAGESTETRTNPTVPVPLRGEAEARPHASEKKTLSQLQPLNLKAALQRKAAGVAPATNPLAPAETASPPPETKTVSSATEKPRSEATGPINSSLTRTIVPPGLGFKNPLFSNVNKAAAMIRKIAPLPADAASATPTLEISTAGAAIPPSQGKPGESRETIFDSESASARENRDAGIATPTDRETFSARQAGQNSQRTFQNDGRTPPVEVHVSIGHIEVKSVQPNMPAPRRTPARPRISLEEFLKHPHYGGPR